MYLESTPHVSLRKRNGLINIDYTACDIIGLNENSSTAAARSYNTIIGVYTTDDTGNKIYLETAGSYSQTTASKHKPRAREIAAYNDYKIIPDIKPDVLHDLYFYADANEALIIREILQEVNTRQELIPKLHANDANNYLINDLKVRGIIKARRAPEDTPYKNGNLLTKYYYRTNFKYISNIYYEVNIKHVKKTLPAYSGRNGPTGPKTTNTILTNIVNIQY